MTVKELDNMRGHMKIYVLIKMFRGIHEGVELFWDEDDAEKAFKKYTRGRKDDWGRIHEDYRDCSIQLVIIPKRKKVRS